MDNLPQRIMKMVKELHTRGYNTLYLYSGMSPSGTNWRFNIGLLKNDKHPEKRIVCSSIRIEGEVDWTTDNSTVELLADGFESYYANELIDAQSDDTRYSAWYGSLIDSFGPEEILVFYADYIAPHEHLLKDAPLLND